MKKFRMMLPMLAFVFAVVGAVAGDFLSPITAYYKVNPTTCSSPQVTEQQNCQLSDDMSKTLCTILVSGSHFPAYKNSNCTGVLRDIQPE
jgi:hypothetical protein